MKSLPTLLLFDGQDFVQQISTSKLPAIQQMIDDYVTDKKSEDWKIGSIFLPYRGGSVRGFWDAGPVGGCLFITNFNKYHGTKWVVYNVMIAFSVSTTILIDGIFKII